MVRITSSGDIVPDDAPQGRPAGGSSGGQGQGPRRRQGQIPHGDGQQQAYSHGPSASIFTEVNQKLRETGIPSWNIGPYVVEPIVSVAAVIAVLFFGLPGLLIVAALFFVSVWSQGQGTGGGAQGAQAGSRNTGGGGGGWRPGGRGGNVLGRR